MLKHLILLSLLALTQGRPQSDVYEPHDDCPAEKHWLLPHEYDCTKFYYCEFGLKWIEPRECAPGTEFSFELQVCVQLMFSECNLPGRPTSEQPTDATDAATTESVITTDITTNPTSAATIESIASSTTAATTPSTVSTTASTTVSSSSTTEAVTSPTTEATTAPTSAPTTVTTSAPTATVSTTASTTEATSAPTTVTTSAPTATVSTTASTTEATSAPTSAPTTVTTSAPTTTSTTEATSAPTSAPTTVTTSGPTTSPTTVSTTEATTAPTTTTTGVPTTLSPTSSTTASSTEAATLSTTEASTNPSTTQPDIEYLENGCPADFHVHQLLPHETACDKFYYCVSGEKIERNCSVGTYFNPEIQVCDWPENVDCVNDNEDDNNTEVDSPDPESEEDETPEGDLLPNGCPADFDVHKLLPHETDCDKFYYCVFGEAVERECAPGTHFNYEIQVCDWPENVNCTRTDENRNEDEDVDDLLSSSPALANGCPADFHVHKLLPHESNCSLFYYCVSGEKIERECAPGTHFNYELQGCDWPWSAGCDSNGTDIGDGDNDNENNGHYNENGDNENEVIIGDGSGNVTVPALPNGCPVDFHVHHLLPHESNCSKFYYCVFGEKVERDCPAGTHFNPVLQVCDWPWNAGCDLNGSDGNGDNNNNENEDEDDEESSDDNEGNGSDDEDSDSDLILPNGCPADFDLHQLLPHENNCSKFYYCVLGEKVERDCPNGTHFNPVYQVCDWPWRAGCETGESDSGNGGSGNEDNGNGNGDDNDDNDDGENEDNEDTDSENNENEDVDNEGTGNGDNGNGDSDNEDNGDGDNEDNGNEDNDNEDNSEGNGNGDNGNGDNDNDDIGNEDSNEGIGNGDGNGDNDNEGNGNDDNDNENNGEGNGNGDNDNGDNGNGDNDSEDNDNEDNDNGDSGSQDNGNEDGGNGNEDNDNGDDDNDNEDAGNGNGNGDGGNGNGVINRCNDLCNALPWAHETDCDKYWICNARTPTLIVCSEGLHFNANTLACDFMCNANCVRDVVQATAESDGLKLFLPWDQVDDSMVNSLLKKKK